MRKMKKSTFYDRVANDHCITDEHDIPVWVHPEFTYNINTGDSTIIFDARLNWDNMSIIQKWLDDNNVKYSIHVGHDFPTDFYTGEKQTEPRYYQVFVLSNDNFIKQ